METFTAENAKVIQIPDPDDSWAMVELHRWQHGHMPQDPAEQLNVPEGLRGMAKAIEVGNPKNFPAPSNVVDVLRFVAKSLEQPTRFPDIGNDPLQVRDVDGVAGAMERLGKAVSLQQPLVPNQTALVWRIDISRIRDEVTWRTPSMATAWEKVKTLTTEVETLRARIATLESYLEKTADGKLIEECENLYCPHCGEIVEELPALAYCRKCVNPDDGEWPHQSPLPLSYGSCLSAPKAKADTRQS